MISNTYDKFNYNTISDIKIYTGTTEYSKAQIDDNVNKYLSLNADNNKIFTSLEPSTLTSKGRFTNISFNEEDIIDMLTTPNGGYITQIGCNYGVLTNPNPLYVKPEVRVRLSNRGRKPKNKPKTRRKLQGSGKYFSSQITFEIFNPIVNKIYKIKLFRNGGFQVPGVINPDMSDLVMPMFVLREYLRSEFIDDKIEIEYFISVMRNYISKLIDNSLLIRLNELEYIFKKYKNDNQDSLFNIIDQSKLIIVCQKSKDVVKEYIGKYDNSICMAEIQNNCERYFGLIVKFYRPVPWKINKRTTIKILRSGKINIDGGNSIEESFELYHWLENIFNTYKDAILYNPNYVEIYDDDYDIGSGCSIYDDAL